MEVAVDGADKAQPTVQDDSVKPKGSPSKEFLGLCATQKTRLIWACALSVGSTAFGLLPFVFIYFDCPGTFSTAPRPGLFMVAGRAGAGDHYR